ncbi:hydroxyacylglutathione hydrolase [Sneathiella chinensis]|uniref:Hydroxyacylglutathione hydrolase n=1 Tax=Sneathiella chinensis TaxID=349750 RepID=A0ABQ5U1K7_9PROT|nr:hydroxyacylglutathione hydrolase [Sneathiella chinensis]GLQ05301.1 hydroxyacylglutathione hydrolase [Sneathiella chinensis]
MSKLEIHQIPVLNDNYLYLIKDPDSDAVAIVDPAVAEPVQEKLDELGWRLTHILNTHHHFDHTGANLELKEKTGCIIVGSKADADRIPGIDIQLEDGDIFEFGTQKARIFEVSGHTLGHIAYWFEGSDALFCGDTLFALGCGRLFEGTPAQMWHSLSKFLTLPDRTKVYCAHEYTEANARFALSVEPQNAALQQRFEDILALRAKGQPTVPSTLGEEKNTNPFLRPDSPDLQETLGMGGADLIDIFAETRARKDSF